MINMTALFIYICYSSCINETQPPSHHLFFFFWAAFHCPTTERLGKQWAGLTSAQHRPVGWWLHWGGVGCCLCRWLKLVCTCPNFKRKHLEQRKPESLGSQRSNRGGAPEPDRHRALCVFIRQESMRGNLSPLICSRWVWEPSSEAFPKIKSILAVLAFTVYTDPALTAALQAMSPVILPIMSSRASLLRVSLFYLKREREKKKRSLSLAGCGLALGEELLQSEMVPGCPYWFISSLVKTSWGNASETSLLCEEVLCVGRGSTWEQQ